MSADSSQNRDQHQSLAYLGRGNGSPVSSLPRSRPISLVGSQSRPRQRIPSDQSPIEENMANSYPSASGSNNSRSSIALSPQDAPVLSSSPRRMNLAPTSHNEDDTLSPRSVHNHFSPTRSESPRNVSQHASPQYSPAYIPIASTSKPPSPSNHLHPNPPDQHNDPTSPRPKDRSLQRKQSSGGSSEHASRREPSTSDKEKQTCSKCQLPIPGQFVRALGTVFHLDCFKCADCGKVVAAKFFPVDGPAGVQYPLCETDYFRRLNLLCAKCGGALRGSYITALDMKFHVEHFTCSVCPTVFGPQDSYYEHSGGVYCHFHYSTRFAVKCTGCRTAILKQFVEINRYDKDEHWHPECYMIHKFWNTKLAPSTSPVRKGSADLKEDVGAIENGTVIPELAQGSNPADPNAELDYRIQEERETSASLKDSQRVMEEKVYRIWTVLSTFEESSAACISEMLRYVSNGQFMEGVRMAEKFVLHVETLFAAIDDLMAHFKAIAVKEPSHVREARMLCKKIVNFFSLLSHTQENGTRKVGLPQELLSLVTGLAHYLKILIRIALTAALKLERDNGKPAAITQFLNRLDRLARDPDASKPTPVTAPAHSPTADSLSATSSTQTKVRTFGYKSLARGVGTLVGHGEATSDLCEICKGTIEDDCARLGTSLRWHLACLRCVSCGRCGGRTREQQDMPQETLPPVLPLKEFRMEPRQESSSQQRQRSGRVYCTGCCNRSATNVIDGFEPVTRLEQYAFLLCVALNKLYGLLKQRGVVPPSPTEFAVESEGGISVYEAYRDSADIKRMKSVNLDRKLSSTARTPKRSTVIQSPSGRSAESHLQPKEREQGSRSRPRSPQQSGSAPSSPPRHSSQPRDRHPSEKPPRPPPLPPDRFADQHRSQVETTRPPMGRALTAVRVIEDTALSPSLEPSSAFASPTSVNEEGITLADLPQVMEAEQARTEHRMPPRPAHGVLLSELSALELIVVKHAAALMIVSETSPLKDIIQMEEVMDLVDFRKNTFWGKFFKGGQDKKVVKKKGVFGVPLELLVDRGGVDSMQGAGAAPVRVPTFIDEVISAMRQMDMSVEGVFRKNGNIRRLRDLTEALDKDPQSVNLVDDNPVQLAALLKKFLRELPEPLLTFKMHHLFIATQNIQSTEQRLRVLHLLCCLLPKPHRDTMEVVFIFMKWVASFAHVDEETGSRMDLANLSIVMGPNILYAKGKDPSKDDSFAGIRAIQDLLENQDRFWQVPAELRGILSNQDLLNNPEMLTSKDILKHCRDYMSKMSSNQHQAYPSPMQRQEVPSQHPHYSPAPASSTANGRPLSYQTQPYSRNGAQPLYRPNTADAYGNKPNFDPTSR